MERSSLARLPPELRNRIYECVLVPHESLSTLGIHRPPDSHPHIKLFGPRNALALALAQTCKALRAESLLIFYSANRFLIKEAFLEDAFGIWRKFQRTAGHDCIRATRHVTIHITSILCFCRPEMLNGEPFISQRWLNSRLPLLIVSLAEHVTAVAQKRFQSDARSSHVAEATSLGPALSTTSSISSLTSDRMSPTTSVPTNTMEGSLFARLSTELRNRIYEHALYRPFPLEIYHFNYLRPRYPFDRVGSPLALTYTCKTIYAESRLLFLSLNHFQIWADLVSHTFHGLGCPPHHMVWGSAPSVAACRIDFDEWAESLPRSRGRGDAAPPRRPGEAAALTGPAPQVSSRRLVSVLE